MQAFHGIRMWMKRVTNTNTQIHPTKNQINMKILNKLNFYVGMQTMVRSFAHRIPWIFIAFIIIVNAYFCTFQQTVLFYGLFVLLAFLSILFLSLFYFILVSISDYFNATDEIFFWFCVLAYGWTVHWNSNGTQRLREYVVDYIRKGFTSMLSTLFQNLFVFLHSLRI